MQEDMKQVLQEAFNVKYDSIKQHLDIKQSVNNSITERYFQEIPASQVEQIREIYKIDFQMFGYDKNIPGSTWWRFMGSDS